MLYRLFTFATIHLPTSAFIELAPKKVVDRSVTAVVIHESKPSPVNFDAL